MRGVVGSPQKTVPGNTTHLCPMGSGVSYSNTRRGRTVTQHVIFPISGSRIFKSGL